MKRKYIGLLAILGLAAFLFGPSPAFAQIPLGTAQNFAVLAGTTVTNTGPTVITTGDVGVSPGTAIVGFPPGIIVAGVKHSADAVALQAQNDLITAYDAVDGTACGVDLTGQDLAGMTLTPNVYCFTGGAGLSAALPLTLNFLGDPDAVFLFKTVSTVITAVGSSVVLINTGGTTCPENVFWKVGSSATIEVGSTFVGNILALTSISVKTGATLTGRALARNGQVSLDTNTVTMCAAIVPPGCPVITVNPPTLPDGTVGTAYSQTITASGGTAPYTFTVSSGTLPLGLTLSAGGALSGTPTTAGTSNFTITATDSAGCPGSRDYSIVIAAAAVCPVITVNPPTLPNGTIGTAYSQTITASGGTAPYTFTVSSGTLPLGLTLSAGGALSGTPTTAGTSNFTITATDFINCPGSRDYSIVIVCPVITVNPPTLPNGTVGTAYSQTITASGGTAPYTFTVSSGTLPPGLTLSAGGTLSGTPTTFGTFNFTITATDFLNCPGSRDYSIVIAAGPGGPAGGPTLDSFGLAILLALLAVAGVFAVNRFTS